MKLMTRMKNIETVAMDFWKTKKAFHVPEREFAEAGGGAGAGEGRQAVRQRRRRRQRGQPRRSQCGPGESRTSHDGRLESARIAPRVLRSLAPLRRRRQPRDVLEPESAALLVHEVGAAEHAAAAAAGAVRRVSTPPG